MWNEIIKKVDKENWPIFKRYKDLSIEMCRLEMVLEHGFITKNMFDKIVLKLDILEKELDEITREKLFKMDKNYHINFLNNIEKDKEKMFKRYKIKFCKSCKDCKISISRNICDECEDNVCNNCGDIYLFCDGCDLPDEN